MYHFEKNEVCDFARRFKDKHSTVKKRQFVTTKIATNLTKELQS